MKIVVYWKQITNALTNNENCASSHDQHDPSSPHNIESLTQIHETLLFICLTSSNFRRDYGPWGGTYLTYVYFLSLCSFVLFRFLIYFISFCVICVATQLLFIVLLFSAYTIGCTSVTTTNTGPTLTPSHKSLYNWRFDCFSTKTREITVVSLAEPQNIKVVV